MAPEPASKGVAGVTPSEPSAGTADVMSAELICPGVQSGCTALTSAATPAAWGEDMEVPAMAWYSSPCGPEATSMLSGELPASDSIPGAVIVGFSHDPTGPREENVVTTSGVTFC